MTLDVRGALARVRPQSLHHIADAVVDQVASGLTIVRYVGGWRVTIDRTVDWSIAAHPVKVDDTVVPDDVIAFAMFIAGEAKVPLATALAGLTYTTSPPSLRLVWKDHHL